MLQKGRAGFGAAERSDAGCKFYFGSLHLEKLKKLAIKLWRGSFKPVAGFIGNVGF